MRRRNRILAVVALCGALGLVWLSWKLLLGASGGEGRSSARPSVADRLREPSMPGLVVPPSSDSETREAAMQDAREALRTPINFFGIVVDRDGNAVDGASVAYVVHKRIDFQGSKTIRAGSSDRQGRFAILGENGLKLFVEVSHPLYRQTESSRQSFEYASIGRLQRPLGATPTEESPVRFVLEKRGATEELIYHERIECQVPLGGEPLAVDVRSGQTGLSTESIVLRLFSDARSVPLNEYRPYDWTASITVPDAGGIQERGKVEYVAPESGYSSSVTVAMPKSRSRDSWSSSLERNFFVRFASGKWARMEASVSGEGFWVLRVWLNPHGSRNLEFDPAKTIPRTP